MTYALVRSEPLPTPANLAVPGSSPKMLEKAKGLPADQVFMDIEDAVRIDAAAALEKARTI